MSSLKLYSYFRSSTSYRVRIALHLKKLNFEYLPVSLINNGGEQHTQAYRNLNPIGGVPTLVNGDDVVSQSVAIIEYLDEAFPETYQLFPKDAFLRAKVRQVCENINSDIHPMNNLKLLQYLEKKHQYTQTDKDAWVQKWTADGLKAVETIIAPYHKTFAFGDSITAADIFIAPQVFTAYRFKLDMSEFKILDGINSRCLKHEAFIKAHPHNQIDTPAEFKIDLI